MKDPYNKFTFDEWLFLEIYMTDYTRSDEIAWIDDIDCVLHDECDDEKRERLSEYYEMSLNQLHEKRNFLMRDVLEDAFMNYLDEHYPITE